MYKYICIGVASHTSDSLRKLIAHPPDEITNAIAIGTLVSEFLSSDPDSAFIYARQSKGLSSSISYQPDISRALNIIEYLRKGIANETGTGLGLLLCSEMIAKHGGQISVLISPGKGSAFSVTLPANIKS